MELKIATNERMKDIKRVYKEAFPKNERMPFWLLRARLKRGSIEILSIEDDGFAGLAIVFSDRDLVLLEYFAIDRKTRGKGVGSDAIQQIRERYRGKRLFLTIEMLKKGESEYELRARRKAFYERNGFTGENLFVSLYGVEMEVLTDGCKVLFQEYYEIYDHIVGKRFAKWLHIYQIENTSRH